MDGGNAGLAYQPFLPSVRVGVTIRLRGKRLGTAGNTPLKAVLTAAGGVVLRPATGGGYEVVVCHRSAAGLWALPKGKPNEGERPLQTALREVREETGLAVKAGPVVDEIHYSFVRPDDGAECDKTVRFYLMRPVGGDVSGHDQEFDAVTWLPVQDAVRLLTFDNEARIVEKAVAMAKAEAG